MISRQVVTEVVVRASLGKRFWRAVRLFIDDTTSYSHAGTPGFTSAPGWDPVTGLGTPNFPKLLERWLLLP